MDKFLVIIAVIPIIKCKEDASNLKFPDGFLFGAASSAYQIEGAWNVSDKAVSIWDDFVHKYPDQIVDRSNGDVSCRSYDEYKTDMNILSDLKFDHYRFSLSWSRLLPKGDRSYVSKDGLRYYNSILDELESRNITPFVTVYHWDHPASLDDSGGWLSEKMAYMYAEYAEFVFENFADRVKYFITVNEPQIFCSSAYGEAIFPPARKLNGTGDYLCLHNMLKGSALAYDIFDKKFRAKKNGSIGIVVQCQYPYSYNSSDRDLSDLAWEFECGWQTHPIFSKTGDYPKVMKDKVAERSRAQGYPISRLPAFSEEWIRRIKGSADFLGLNYYTSSVVEPLPKSEILDWPNDEGIKYTTDPRWTRSQASWLNVVPEGLRDLLNMIRDKYNNPAVYITENGVADGNGTNDNLRIDYYYTHLKAVLLAIQDGCNVRAHTAWSLLDSFEWNFGYTTAFGLVQVDFEDPNRARTFKKSTSWYKTLLRTRKLPPID